MSISVYPINNTIMSIEPLISFVFQLLSNVLPFIKIVKYDKTFVIFKEINFLESVVSSINRDKNLSYCVIIRENHS